MARHPRAKWIGLALLAAALAAGLAVRQGLSKPSTVPILTPIERGDVVMDVEATGTVDAVTTVNVGSQISGMIKEILVDFNSPVKQGQVLAIIEDTRFAAAVKQAEANLAAAQAEVRIAETAVESAHAGLAVARANLARAQALERKAALDFERQETLFALDVSAAAERDRWKSAYDSARATTVSSQALLEEAKARLAQGEAALLQARAEEKERAGALDSARTNLSYTVIKSPMDGVVVARNVDVGQTVAARLSAPNLFNIAQDLEHMYVYTKLDVLDVSHAQVGQKATFTVDAFPKRVWEGKVVQVRISPITQTRGLAAPSQLGAPAPSTIPGLQQQSGPGSSSASAPAGSSAGALAGQTAGSAGGGSSGGGSSSGGAAPGSTPAPGLVHYDALIEFANSDGRLLPGMTAYVTIPVAAAYNVLRVRKEALRASPAVPDAEKKALLQRHGIASGKDTLWIAEGTRYRPVAVRTGTTDYLFAEITSGDVKEGQPALAGYRQRDQ